MLILMLEKSETVCVQSEHSTPVHGVTKSLRQLKFTLNFLQSSRHSALHKFLVSMMLLSTSPNTHRRIPFRTVIQADPRLPASPSSLPIVYQSDSLLPTATISFSGLGYEPMGYKPDFYDYKSYELLCNRFLTSSRGRVALMTGGIIERLAREVVKEADVYAELSWPKPAA